MEQKTTYSEQRMTPEHKISETGQPGAINDTRGDNDVWEQKTTYIKLSLVSRMNMCCFGRGVVFFEFLFP